MKQRIGYSGAQIALHWTIAVLILFNYIYSDGMGRALHARLDGTPATDLGGINPSVHVWVGVAVLVLSLIRLGLRLGRGVPEPGGEGLVQVAAEWGSPAAVSADDPGSGRWHDHLWFGRVDAAGDIHGVLANALMIVAGGHAAMAIYHQFVMRDGLLDRMTRPGDM